VSFPPWEQNAFVPNCKGPERLHPNDFTTASCCPALPSQPEKQAAQDNQRLDVIGTQMRNSSDKKDMEKEGGFC